MGEHQFDADFAVMTDRAPTFVFGFLVIDGIPAIRCLLEVPDSLPEHLIIFASELSSSLFHPSSLQSREARRLVDYIWPIDQRQTAAAMRGFIF